MSSDENDLFVDHVNHSIGASSHAFRSLHTSQWHLYPMYTMSTEKIFPQFFSRDEGVC